MNEEKHWNKIAPTYNDEIFDVFASDKKNILTQYFDKHTNLNHNAIDFGCGNGKAFCYLAPRFKNILGIDISENLLTQAILLNYENVELRQADLTKNIKLAKADFIFCCNVAILSKVEDNIAMIKNISKALKPKGSALVVVPSLESAMYSGWRMIDWYKKEKTKPEDIDAAELASFKKKTDILQGLIAIDGVTTKHYSQEEIEVIFSRCGLSVSNIEKIEYDWNSEFAKPPKWMQTPYPWDWLIEVRK